MDPATYAQDDELRVHLIVLFLVIPLVNSGIQKHSVVTQGRSLCRNAQEDDISKVGA